MDQKRALAAIVVLATISECSICAAANQDTHSEAPYPATHATTDPAVVERGGYLALHVAVCGHCHSETNGVPEQDGEVHLSGRAGTAAFVEMSTPNITSDVKTGIGAFSDAAIARSLRYRVGHDGAALGVMNFNFSDEDLTAVVSYLRTTKPVERQMPTLKRRLPPGPAAPPEVAAAPSTPLKRSPRGVSVKNGRYLVEAVGDCGGCHTPRNFAFGEPGPSSGGSNLPALSGAAMAMPDEHDPQRLFRAPNLTRGGRLAAWDENSFVARFQAGRLLEGSPMPWEAYQGMKEDDLRSIYRYLKSLPAAHTPEYPTFEIRAQSEPPPAMPGPPLPPR